MIKDLQRQFNQLYILTDAAVISDSCLPTWRILFGLYRERVGRFSFAIYMQTLFFITPLYLLLGMLFGLYVLKRTKGWRVEFAGILKVSTIDMPLSALMLYLGSKNVTLYHFSCRLVLISYLTRAVWMTIERNVVRSLLWRMRQLSFNQKDILLVGCGEAAKDYINRTLTNAEWGYQINSILDDTHEPGFSYHGVRIIGAANELRPLLERSVLDETAIILPLSQYKKLENIIFICEESGVHTKFIPDYCGIISTILYMKDVASMPITDIRHMPLTEFYGAAAKRLVDIIDGIVGLVVFSPVMLLTVILVKISSPGPIAFKQERVGLHQKKF